VIHCLQLRITNNCCPNCCYVLLMYKQLCPEEMTIISISPSSSSSSSSAAVVPLLSHLSSYISNLGFANCCLLQWIKLTDSSHSKFHISCSLYTVSIIPDYIPSLRSCITFFNMLFLMVRSYQTHSQPLSWKTTSCWLAMIIYSIYLQLQSISGHHLQPKHFLFIWKISVRRQY
jgi:hypothetical protein